MILVHKTKTFSIIGSSTVANNIYTFKTNYTYNPIGIDVLSLQPTDGSTQIFAKLLPIYSWNYINGNFNVF